MHSGVKYSSTPPALLYPPSSWVATQDLFSILWKWQERWEYSVFILIQWKIIPSTCNRLKRQLQCHSGLDTLGTFTSLAGQKMKPTERKSVQTEGKALLIICFISPSSLSLIWIKTLEIFLSVLCSDNSEVIIWFFCTFFFISTIRSKRANLSELY